MSVMISILVVLLAGCVEARDTASQGDTHYISGVPSNGLDYQSAIAGSGGVAGEVAGQGGTAALPTAGMVADPLNPMSSTSGEGGSAGTSMPGGTGGQGGSAGLSGSGGTAGNGGGGGGGASGSGGTGGEAGAGPASAGTLTIDFMSVGNDGEYAPRNVGAVWIETSSGQFVKTIKRWAGIRAGHLTRWTEASGGWGGGFFFASGGGNAADEMDAISAATLRPHQQHDMTWDMQDPNGMLVPDGMYRIVIEVTESERIASVSAEIEFEKGPAPVTLSPSDEGPYSGLTVTYTP